MLIVLDASVCLKWYLSETDIEPDRELAFELLERLRDGRVRLIQPPVWQAEVATVLARRRASEAEKLLGEGLGLGVYVDAGNPSLLCATDLSIRLNHHVFDTIYHAVAIENAAVLVTGDTHYYRKAHALGHIELLRDWQPDTVAEPRASYAALPRKRKATKKSA